MLYRYTCPCCANALLRHTRAQGVYWRCGHCRQEMPILEHRFSKLKVAVMTNLIISNAI